MLLGIKFSRPRLQPAYVGLTWKNVSAVRSKVLCGSGGRAAVGRTAMGRAAGGGTGSPAGERYSGSVMPKEKFRPVANVRYISQSPVTRCQKPRARSPQAWPMLWKKSLM